MRKIFSLILTLTLVAASFGFVFADTAYIVKSGDTLSKIAQKYSTTYQELAKFNKIINVNQLSVNQNIMIPSGASAAKTTITAGQKAYLKHLIATGTSGQKAWALAQLSKARVAKAQSTNLPTPIASLADLPVKGSTMVLASTTSTQDTGLFDVLIPAFGKKYGVITKVVAVGSGEAIAMGERGDADVLLVHSRAAEDHFITDGFGINRKDVMYNFYYIVGPKADPAKIKGLTSASNAFKLIADTDSIFISRADKSGTNTKELAIWKKAMFKPVALTDRWYLEAGKGMGDTLTMSNEMGTYTLVDSGTWGSMKDKMTQLEIMVQGDTILYNPYGVISVNPAKYANTNIKAATAFENFITSAEGQKIIGTYTKNGQRLFVPSAK